MRLVCVTLALLASLWGSLGAQTPAQREALAEAAWAFSFWAEAVRAEAAALGLAEPVVRTRYAPEAGPPGALNLLGVAGPGSVVLRLEGSGWRARSVSAERLLARNAAHEAAHLYQYARGAPTEPRWLHEGFADALAREQLSARGAAGGWAGGQRCAGALRRGTLRARFAADDEAAVYGCGSVVIRAVAAARGESVRAFYDAFVAAGRGEDAFAALAEDAGPDWSRSARAFLTRDWTQSDPAWVIRSLRAGRL